MIVEVIIKYWVQWVCALVAAGVVFFARRYVKLERKALEDKWKEREQKAKNEVMEKITKDHEEEVAQLKDEDRKIRADIESLYLSLENLNTGILSLQGMQFRDTCEWLLSPDHYITVQEYEQFEEDYVAYKGLGGNHRGDALHKSVIEKFNKQL